MTVYQTPGLRGLEVWHARARGVTLFQLRHRKAEYFSGLCEFLVRLYAGEAATDSARDTERLAQAAGFERVIFCGGEARHPALQQALCALPLPFAFQIDCAGEFAARRGALRIFEENGWRHAVALDLGQTQLKVITPTSCHSLARDMEWLPATLDAETGRARLREFLRSAYSLAPGLDGVVLALPVELDGDGSAEPATYPGLCGPVEPLFADLFPMPWVVLNDAVLAAVGFRPADGRKTLILTLGFGIGGALWNA